MLADFDRRLVRYEAFHRRAHRYESSTAQINLFGAALTTLRQAKAAEHIGAYTRVSLWINHALRSASDAKAAGAAAPRVRA